MTDPTRYTVVYGNGARVNVLLPGRNVPAQLVVAAAEEAEPTLTAEQVPAMIVRDAGLPPEMVVWRRLDADRSEATIELPEEEADPEPFRLFVSFSYDHGGTPAFGNTMLDIEFEPCTPEHVGQLQTQIATFAEVGRVIILGWQRVEKP